MLLADARLPTAGHTQSGGLEPALLGGLDPGDLDGVLPDPARDRDAHRGGNRGGMPVARPSPAGPPTTSSSPGRQGLPAPRCARPRGRSDGRTGGWRSGCGRTRRPGRAARDHDALAAAGSLGLVAAATGLSADAVARLVAYEDVQSVLAASLKLLPGDPVDATARLLDLSPAIDASSTASPA